MHSLSAIKIIDTGNLP